jgi:plasmid stability protein
MERLGLSQRRACRLVGVDHFTLLACALAERRLWDNSADIGTWLMCSHFDCIMLRIAKMSHTLTLRNVPDPVLRALRGRARRNRRSMQKEIISILEQAAVDRASMVEQLATLRRRLRADMTLDEIHRAIEEGRA